MCVQTSQQLRRGAVNDNRDAIVENFQGPSPFVQTSCNPRAEGPVPHRPRGPVLQRGQVGAVRRHDPPHQGCLGGTRWRGRGGAAWRLPPRIRAVDPDSGALELWSLELNSRRHFEGARRNQLVLGRGAPTSKCWKLCSRESAWKK